MFHIKTNALHVLLSGVLVLVSLNSLGMSSYDVSASNTALPETISAADPPPVPFPLQAPLPAGVTFTVGTPGNFYGDCVAGDKTRQHCGVDYYAVDINATDFKTGGDKNNDQGILILAAADGWVKLAGNNGGYGYSVVISHPSRYQTRYGHLLAVPFVKEGDWVEQGTPIGIMGSTGSSTAPHLHFSLYYCDPKTQADKCQSNLKPSKPEPMGTVSNLTDGQKVVSSNYGAGYYEITDVKLASPGFDAQIKNVYARLREINFLTGTLLQPMQNIPGGIGVIGSATAPVKNWQGQANIYYQEFNPFPGSIIGWANYYFSGIVDVSSRNQAFFIGGPIWEKYKIDGGPTGKWGNPVDHSYSWNVMSNYGLRSDFENGSIIWSGGNQYEFLDQQNAPWKGEFFTNPNSFSGEAIRRRDKTIDFAWSNASFPGPIITTSGFSAHWEETEEHLINVSKFVIPELQGHLILKIKNGNTLLTADSPDQVRNFQTNYQFSIGNQVVEVFYWQEKNKKGRLSLTTQGIIPIAFALEGAASVDGLPAPDLDYANYNPPPYPGDPAIITPSPQSPIPSGSSSTVLVLDTSGSMAEQDASQKMKLQAAQDAANSILNIIAAEVQSGSGQGSQVGLVDFNAQPKIDAQLTTDIASTQNSLQSLNPGGGTGMAEGLKTGLSLFSTQSSSAGKQMILLLSDGNPNIPLAGTLTLDKTTVQQQVIDLATQAGSQGICVYTIGFGIPNTTGAVSGTDPSIDEEFLKRVASASTCGAYYNAQDSVQLANVFVELRHSSMGNVLLKKSGQISQDQQIDLGAVEVPANQDLMLFTLNWPGSRLEPVLKDPSGKVVDSNYPDATISVSPSLVSIIMNNPKPGSWKLSVVGAEVPEGTTQYNTVLSTRTGALVKPPQGNSSFPIVILVLVLAGGGVGIYVYSNTLKRSGQRSIGAAGSGSALVGSAGMYAGKSIPLRDGFVIGRGSGSSIRLVDPSVSRWHARLRFAQGNWFIQDLSSKSGTFVNGQRVNAARLNPGDQIQIGASLFTFQAGGK